MWVFAVKFYIDDEEKATVSESPYEMLWDEFAFGGHTIKAITTDRSGKIEDDQINLWIFIL